MTKVVRKTVTVIGASPKNTAQVSLSQPIGVRYRAAELEEKYPGCQTYIHRYWDKILKVPRATMRESAEWEARFLLAVT